jgi:WD40 repeat protein
VPAALIVSAGFCQVTGLEFSELTPNRLASGANEGDVRIWDLKNPSEPEVFPPLKVYRLFGKWVVDLEDDCIPTLTSVMHDLCNPSACNLFFSECLVEHDDPVPCIIL